jgi:uncharacterized caspase-like protein
MDAYQKKFLVAVGIDKYRHADTLRHAVDDAKAMVKLFKSFGFEATELYDAEATKAKISETLELVTRSAGKNDLVVFFFAGHGIDMRDSEGLKGYLVPVEGRTTEPKDLLPMNWLQIDLLTDRNIKVKHMLFLLDACSSGIVAARSSVNVDVSVKNYISELLKRQAREVITAGTGNQQVLDGGYEGHSIFAGLVLQGLRENQADLNNDYHITATELGLFLSQKVYIQSKGAQKPDFGKLLGTKGGEVILRFPNDAEKSILAERNRNVAQTETDLVLDIRPAAADVLIYDLKNNLMAEERKVNGRIRIQKLPPGDYQIMVRSRDSRYDSVMMILGIYGPVARDVTLPRRMYRVSSVPIL